MVSTLNSLSLVLEFVRTDQGDDPYAFRMTRQEYLLRSVGGGFDNAELSWDQALLDDLSALRGAHPEAVVLSRLGETLRQFLELAGWSQHESAILAAVHSHRRVVLTIRSAAAELYALPWELVTLKNTGQHLVELPGVLVRYEWPETTSVPPRRASPSARGRILFAWSAASGAVPAAGHLAAIEDACRESGHPFVPERDVLPHVTAVTLAEALAAAAKAGEPIAALHLLCHGGAAGSNFGLVFETSDGDRQVIDAGHLRRILAPHAGLLRLVVIMACNSADNGALGNQLGSVAQALHRAGIAQVVASRYPLTVEGSLRLTEVLYHKLLSSDGSLDAALISAREDLARHGGSIDWVSLQLFARTNDGNFLPPGYLLGDSSEPKSSLPSATPGLAAKTLSASPHPAAAQSKLPSWVLLGALGGVLCVLTLAGYIWHSHSLRQQAVAQPPPSMPHPQPSPAVPNDYRGVVLSGSSPVGGAKLTLVATNCETSSDGRGVWSFKSCADTDGLARLANAKVVVSLPENSGRSLSCAGKLIPIEKPPTLSTIDVGVWCKRKEAPRVAASPPRSEPACACVRWDTVDFEVTYPKGNKRWCQSGTDCSRSFGLRSNECGDPDRSGFLWCYVSLNCQGANMSQWGKFRWRKCE